MAPFMLDIRQTYYASIPLAGIQVDHSIHTLLYFKNSPQQMTEIEVENSNEPSPQPSEQNNIEGQVLVVVRKKVQII
jgi:hypothetical protein